MRLMYMVMPVDPNIRIMFVYTNHRGETATRRVKPEKVYFGKSEWHPEDQWLMDGTDLDKNEPRTFALADMKPVED